MASMCEECKCSTYYNDELDMYSCENECPCCNDPNYESDWDVHLRIMKQIKAYIDLTILSLNQDSNKLQEEMDSIQDLNSDEYESLEIEDISLNGQIIGLIKVQNYLKELEV